MTGSQEVRCAVRPVLGGEEEPLPVTSCTETSWLIRLVLSSANLHVAIAFPLILDFWNKEIL